MNLNQLRFADAVAATTSFTAAAAQCFVTQPTLSNGIAQLESELGERLFVRTTRQVALTPFGEHILPYLGEVLRAQAALVQQTQAFLNPQTRLIRIGTSPLINTSLLGLMIEPFRLSNPSVEVVLREMNMADLYRMLDGGLLDFAFGVVNARKGPFMATLLYEEPLLFVPRGGVWPKSASSVKSTNSAGVQIRDISDETYVMVPDSCGLSSTTRALFRSQRRKLHAYSGEAMSYQVLQDWAALGVGAAILPKSKVADNGRPAYPIVDKAGAAITIGFEAMWSRTSIFSDQSIEFLQHLRKVVPAIVEGVGTR